MISRLSNVAMATAPADGGEIDPRVAELGEGESFTALQVMSHVFAEILDQDIVGMEQSQAGMRYGGDCDLMLSRYQEVRIRHLHHTLHRYLNGES